MNRQDLRSSYIAGCARRRIFDLGDVAQLLGHRSVQTTYQFYGRWTTDELHALHAKYTWLSQEAIGAIT